MNEHAYFQDGLLSDVPDMMLSSDAMISRRWPTPAAQPRPAPV